ncbi:MAG: Asp-tRNA(Asn)/Glu-tRNA(Gln) amidotransferase subunit GatB [Firmicutes bacterium]|nr:Asp-tRNA(Asn)/Glu-tRNA(Gln) amidotransferase subunit GatB [Bacillota bacterium]
MTTASLETGYETVIGLEIHVELLTESKVYCSCSTEFGGEPNTRVCPVCLGLPGVLPVLNEKAVLYTVMIGLALNCRIPSASKFDRKNYFYPDLPKAYQISQYDSPVCVGGYLDIPGAEGSRRIGIVRVHLEEETGKSVHSSDNILGSEYSLLDFNRSGIPLVEIVTGPDVRSPEEARLFLEELKTIVQYTGASDCKMDEGSLRCDANISLRPRGASALGTKTEIKNMNSFRAVERALEYEVKRQAELLRGGGKVVQETRHWDEARGVTVFGRSKEEADDYRYFPEPDLVPLAIPRETVERLRAELPELPAARRRRYVEECGLPEYDARVITTSRKLADFFEECMRLRSDPKTLSNWIMGELSRLLNEEDRDLKDSLVTPSYLVCLIDLVEKGTVSTTAAKQVFEATFRSGKPPIEVIRDLGLEQISDASELDGVIDNVIAENPDAVASFKAGKEKAIGALVGQVMKLTRGKANPGLVNELLRKKLAGA